MVYILMLVFLLGLIFGYGICAILTASKYADEKIEKYYREEDNENGN